MTFVIKPLEGIEWNGQLIPLGSSKREFEMIFGQPDRVGESFYYFKRELRFDFDSNGTVELIEFLGGIDGTLQPEIYGVHAFAIPADALVEVLKAHNCGAVVDKENGYSYAFCQISVGVYRESIPKNIDKMIEEMKAHGEKIEENQNLEIEKKKVYHWATIGVGRNGYYGS